MLGDDAGLSRTEIAAATDALVADGVAVVSGERGHVVVQLAGVGQ